jgi:hypothetical protein
MPHTRSTINDIELLKSKLKYIDYQSVTKIKR